MKKTWNHVVALLLLAAFLLSSASCALFPSLKAGLDAVGKDAAQGKGDGEELTDVVQKAISLPQENPGSDCRAKQYKMELTLDTAIHCVTGSVIVDVENRTEQSLENLCFRYFAAEITPESAVSEAKNADGPQTYAITHGDVASVLYLALGTDAIAPGDTLSVRLDFSSAIPELDDRFGYHISQDGTMYNLSFCFPQLSFLKDGVWDTDPYYDPGESTVNEMADYEVTFRAPAEFRVLSSGKSETKNGVTAISAPSVREMAIVACDFGEITERKENGVRFRMLKPTYRMANAAYRDAIYDLMLEAAVSAVAFYTEHIGAYCYDELDVVPIAMDGAGGMEMPGLIMVGVAADLPRTTDGTTVYDNLYYLLDTVAHETAHQWFYCAVGNDQYNEAWLDESFAMYCSCVFLQSGPAAGETAQALSNQYGGENGTLSQYCELAFAPHEDETGPINLPCNGFADAEAYYTAVYGRGLDFLRTLADGLGEDRFFGILADWYKENNGKLATARQFVVLIAQADDSEETKETLNAYLDSARL